MTSGSRLVAFEQIKRNWLKHEDRLIHIKSTLNTRRPIAKVPSSKKTNFSQNLEVQLENKALLKKLTDRVHPRQDVSVCCQSANSLPKSNRKKYYEEYRIRCENEGLYRRLKRTKPMIDLESMRIQRNETEKLLNTISKFGYKNLKPTKTLLKFDMSNNELKYLSKRKIFLDQKLKSSQEHSSFINQYRQQKVLDQQIQKQKHNEKLFNYLSRFRQIRIDSQDTILKITRGTNSIMIELSKLSDKENSQGELEVEISKEIFKEKYHQDLEELINKFKYDEKTKNFYIL